MIKVIKILPKGYLVFRIIEAIIIKIQTGTFFVDQIFSALLIVGVISWAVGMFEEGKSVSVAEAVAMERFAASVRTDPYVDPADAVPDNECHSCSNIDDYDWF